MGEYERVQYITHEKSRGDVLARWTSPTGEEWVWFKPDNKEWPGGDLAARFEPVPVPVPKVGEHWGYREGGLKWLVIDVNETEGHYSLAEIRTDRFTGNYLMPSAFYNSERNEVSRSDFKGYTRRLPEKKMKKIDD